jgi:DNA uptake protein ComE-like DNA-binding protein
MAERLDEPPLAWYRLEKREIGVIVSFSLLFIVLWVTVLLSGSGAVDVPAEPLAAPPVMIYVNKAGAAELTALPGIGQAKAERLVRARQEQPIRDLEELAQAVGGLQQQHLERMRPYVSFDDGQTQAPHSDRR